MTDHRWTSERRAFLRHLVGATSAVGASVLVDPVLGRSDGAQASTPVGRPYTPNYFNEAEWQFLNAAVDRIIPSNADGPGAVELQVPRFIDKQMDSEYGHGGFWYLHGPFDPSAASTLGYQQRYAPRDLYRAAVPAIDQWCLDHHGRIFAGLDAATQDDVLGALEKNTIDLPNVKASAFFEQLLANTKEGYFADPMYGGNLHMGAWKMIGFPGARADFKDWLSQHGTRYPLGPVSIEGEKS